MDPGCAGPQALPHTAALNEGRYAIALFFILLGAVGLGLGLPNPWLHFPPLVLLYPACLYWLAGYALSGRQALLHGWALGLAAHCIGLYWLIFPMHDVAQVPFILAIPCVIVLCGYFALYSALACLAIRNLRQWAHRSRLPFPIRLLAAPLMAGAAFAGFEALCGLVLTGFPWLTMSTAFAFWPAWAQGAFLFGSHTLSAVYAAAACFAASSLDRASPAQRLGSIAAAAGLLFVLPAYGAYRLQQPAPSDATACDIIMVQGNIDQNQKWLPAFQKATLEHYLDLSAKAIAESGLSHAQGAARGRPLLLLWPETAMPFYYQMHYDYAETLLEFAAGNNLYLAFGTLGLRIGNEGENLLYNRLYLLSPGARVAGHYDKRHLVPFGEYTPFAVDLPFLKALLQGLDFTSGGVQRPLAIPLAAKDRLSPSASGSARTTVFLGPLICYEAIFSYLAQSQVEQGATILINISNDGWFRKSSAPLQHLAHAVLRAIEQMRPLARSTNTGVSAVIDERGIITTRSTKPFTAETLAAILRPVSDTSPYHRIFPYPEAVLITIALFCVTIPRLRTLLDRKQHAPAP